MGYDNNKDISMQTVTVIVIDSRSKEHPDWVQACIDSILNQTVEVKLIVVDNTKRDKTIGKCWNEAVKQVDTEWCFFVGDDCFLARDCVQVMLNHTDKNTPCVTTFMTMFDEKEYRVVQRPCTGMWKREYLLKYPFNETLVKGIDREYFEEAVKRNDPYYVISYYFGHYDRRHDDHRSGRVKLEYPKEKQDIYITSEGGTNFIDPLAKRWKENKKVLINAQPFHPEIKTDIIWCEWANENAIAVGDFKTDARKFLRLHAYEAFTPQLFRIKWNGFEKVIFIAEHIKGRVEALVGKIPNAVVIPVGIDLGKFTLRDKKPNNKIAYAGQISRKKGAGELMLLAKSLPDYEFHLAGKYIEDDVADYFNKGKPDNLFIHPYSYNLNEWFKDYTYIINTSMREGNPITTLEAMACGLKPLVRDWLGSEIYGEYVYKNIEELKKLLEGSYEPEEYRSFVEDNYNFEKVYKEIEKLFEVEEWRHLEPEHKTI